MLRSMASRSFRMVNNRRSFTPELLFCFEKQKFQEVFSGKSLLNSSSAFYHHTSLVLPSNNLSLYHHQPWFIKSCSTSASNTNIKSEICSRPTTELNITEEECHDDEFEDKFNKIISLFISYSDNGCCSVPLQAILDCNDDYWDMLLGFDFLMRVSKDPPLGFNDAHLWDYFKWLFSRDDFNVTQSMLSYIIEVFGRYWQFEKECWDLLWQFVKRIGGKETGLITNMILYDLIEAYRHFPDDHIPIEILDKHEEFGCVPSYGTYFFAWQGISNLDVLLDYFKRVFSTDDTAKFTESMVADIVDIFLVLWGRDTDLHPLHLLWDFVKRIGGSGSGVVTTDMLNELSFTFANQGDSATVIEILDKFEEFGCVPDLESYYFIAINATNYTDESLDLRVCQNLVDLLPDGDRDGSSLIHTYIKKQKPELAHAIYVAIKGHANASTVFELILSLSKQDKTLCLATDMLADLTGKVRTTASTIISLCRVGDMEGAKKLI